MIARTLVIASILVLSSCIRSRTAGAESKRVVTARPLESQAGAGDSQASNKAQSQPVIQEPISGSQTSAPAVEKRTDSTSASAPVVTSTTAVDGAVDPKFQNPFTRFGPQVILQPDGKLTKFFSVRSGKGKIISEYLARYAAIPAAQIDVVPGADSQEVRVQPFATAAPATTVAVSDWVVVSGTWDEIERSERLVNLYFCSVPQIEIEARIAEVTTSDVVDIGVRSTDPAKSMFQSGKHNFISALNPKFPNSSSSEGLLSLTAVQSPIQFNATLELLASRRDVDIISTPRIAVRNGGRAEIINGNDIPYAEVTTVVAGVPTSTIRYKQTGVKLFVTPYLAGQDTVLLSLEVESSIPTNVTETSTASVNPIVATRSAKTDVHIRDGNTFVIGGLISTNNLEQVNKVPLLGDIPILGLLFRSTLTQKTSTEVLFFITPRVIREPGNSDLVVPNPN